MTSFKDEWDLEMALEVLKNNSVDSQTWSEAAKWLMLYGPPDLQEILTKASSIATESCFPELTPDGYTESGEPCYNIDKIAEALGMTRDEAVQKISELEQEHRLQHLFDETETKKIH